ncbi:MAG TPA: DUF5305 domain-containing protein [Clostridiales bacterium]|nr:DUF5305 domain-containing protein [Clostridiales bacterium]
MQLIDNNILDVKTMEEGKIYPQKLFDKLQVCFYAEFLSSFDDPSITNSYITADYVIEVKVTGYQTIKDEKISIYEKVFPISEESQLSFENDAYISEEVSIDFLGYENYLNNIKLALAADPYNDAELIFRGNFYAETKEANKKEEFTYSIPLPLYENLFTIEKPANVEKSGSIIQTTLVEESITLIFLLIPAALIIISLLFIIYILIFTIKPSEDEELALHFKYIMRKHGSRIVGINSFVNVSLDTVFEIKDIDGMIKISDEYNIPIFFIVDDNGMPEGNKMFIPTKEICYIYIAEKI